MTRRLVCATPKPTAEMRARTSRFAAVEVPWSLGIQRPTQG
jgi:hypothetical protein